MDVMPVITLETTLDIALHCLNDSGYQNKRSTYFVMILKALIKFKIKGFMLKE